MTDHTHSQYVAGCYRCDLSRDEVASGYVTAAMIEEDLRDHYMRSARAALAAVLPGIIQQAKAEAWEEGHASGCADPYAKYGECGCGPNPYRERGES